MSRSFYLACWSPLQPLRSLHMFSTDISMIQAVSQAPSLGNFCCSPFSAKFGLALCVCVCVCVCVFSPHSGPGIHMAVGHTCPCFLGFSDCPGLPIWLQPLCLPLSPSVHSSASRQTSDSSSLQPSRKPSALGGRSFLLEVCF